MIDIAITTTGSIILDGPYCSEDVAKNAKMKKKDGGRERIIFPAALLDELIVQLAVMRAKNGKAAA